MPLEVGPAPPPKPPLEARPAAGGAVRRAARWAFSFPAMLICGLGVLMLATVRDRFHDPDMWWHLKVGEIIWNTRALPRADLFSYTTGNHPWIPHEWLAEWTIYAAYRVGGYGGLMLWLSGFAALVVIGVYALSWMRSGNAKVALVGGLAAWLFATMGLAVRPLILGHLFLVAELIIIELARTRGSRWLWLLPPLFALWVNCHGSFALGLVVLAVYTVASRVSFPVPAGWPKPAARLLPLVLLLSAAALLVNPIGPKLALYPLDLLFNQSLNVQVVDEWQPLPLLSPRGIGVVLVAGLVSAMALAGRARLQLDEASLLLLGTVLAVRHERMTFAFGILAAPVLCRVLRDVWEAYRPDRDYRAANAVLMAVAAVLAAVAFPGQAALEEQVKRANPVGAVNYIRSAGLSGPMLNEYTFGGFLIWALPEHKTFIDGRADIFDWTGVLGEYGRWKLLAEDPALLLDRYGINFVLLPATSHMLRVLPYLPGWRAIYSDDVAVVFARNARPGSGTGRTSADSAVELKTAAL